VSTEVQAPRVTADVADSDGDFRADRIARLALAVFVVVAIAVLPVVLLLARRYWFFWDEWDFLAGRDGGSVDDLLRPHNEHWSTLPILAYRALWRLFGLRTYVPYQVVSVALHVTVAALLRVVMRRAGVGPWIATAAASLFALFGAGDQNIVWPFQMAWTAAMAFGITQLLLADHDGPIVRRDWIALLAGLLGVLCSGIAVTMTIVVGMAMLIRRGRRVAVFQTAPLGVVYLIWWLAYARDSYEARAGSLGLVVRFVAYGLWGTFDALGQLPAVGIGLAVLLVIGLVLAWRPLERNTLRRGAAVPAAMLVGPAVFLLITALGRGAAFGASAGRSSRYLYIVAAFLLPGLAIAADAVARRWRILTPAVLVVLVVGIPGNIKLFADHSNGKNADFQLGYKRLILAVGHVRFARDVPRSEQVDPVFADDLTIGWLLDGMTSGQVPHPGPIEPADAATTSLGLALRQSPFGKAMEPCHTLDSPLTRRLEKGESIGIDGGELAVVYLPDGAASSYPVRFNATKGPRLAATAGPLTLRLAPVPGSTPVKLCA
jgi:hypothetical protein